MRLSALSIFAVILITIAGCAPLKTGQTIPRSSCDRILAEFNPFLSAPEVAIISRQMGLEVVGNDPGRLGEYLLRIVDLTPVWHVISEMKSRFGAYVFNARSACAE